MILSNAIQKDLKFDIANHVAYATYATSWIHAWSILKQLFAEDLVL